MLLRAPRLSRANTQRWLCHRRCASLSTSEISEFSSTTRKESRRHMPIPTLAEKLQWLKPAPATRYEKDCAAKLAQGDYEIGVQVTNDILDEAMEIFVRSSRSYFGVSGDSMVAIFTAGGDLINASCGTYLHAIIQPVIIKFILKYYEQNPGIRDGD